MSDNLTPSQRTTAMRQVKAKNTSPELIVRQLLREIGYSGYRLHRKDLPGRPDIAYLGRHKVVFVHGCFWHGHDCPRGARVPVQNRLYWSEKITRNRQRDMAHRSDLEAKGWQLIVVWECELKDIAALTRRLKQFMLA